VVAAYNQGHADKARLNIVVASQLVQKFAAAEAAGSAPDALSLDLIYTPAFASAGQLRDLTDWAHGLPYFSHLSPAHIKTGTWKGRLYALPFSAEASILVYNKKLFQAAGLDPNKPPTNWADLRADAERIAALGGGKHGYYFSGACGGCLIFTFAPYIWADGGGILSEDGQKAVVDNKATHEAIGLYRDLVAHGGVPADAQSDNGANFVGSFAAGDVGIQGVGAFAIGLLTTKYKSVDFGVTPIPGRDGGSASFAGGDNIVITRDSKKAALVRDFITWSYTLGAQRVLAAHGSLPVRLDTADAALAGLDPRYAVPQKAMATGRTPYSVVFNDIINSNNGPWVEMVNKAIFSDDPDAAIREGQAKMQAIIDRGRPKG
jgi:multiple sugar transport system substrate-binding protein